MEHLKTELIRASSGLTPSFRYWKIRDYAYSYRSRITTPTRVAEYVISAIEEFNNNNKNPPTPQLVSFDAEDVRKQAAASTQRFEEGAFISKFHANNFRKKMLASGTQNVYTLCRSQYFISDFLIE
ncbi:putative fatty acid amide hydrolase [Helianthus anomalus]